MKHFVIECECEPLPSSKRAIIYPRRLSFAAECFNEQAARAGVAEWLAERVPDVHCTAIVVIETKGKKR